MFEAIWEHWFLLLLVSAGLVVLWTVAVLSKYVRLMLNIIRDTPPLLMAPGDFERLEGQRITFRAFDGTRLEGMFLSSDILAQDQDRAGSNQGFDNGTGGYLSDNSRGVIIFCHEYGSDMYSWVRYCRSLLEAGFDIFTFDFRNHGRSGGLPGYQSRLWCTDKEVLDCLGALALVQSELEDRNLNVNIGLFGISRGAGAALIAAAQAQKKTLVKAILADGAFSTDITLEWFMKKWAHVFARVRFVYENHRPFFWHFLCWLLLKFARIRFNCRFPSVRKTLMRLKNMPIFFVHGERDSYIDCEQAKMLFETAHRPRYLWIVPGAKHNQSSILDTDRYAAYTLGMFEKYLTGGSPEQSRVDKRYRDEVWAFFAEAENTYESFTEKRQGYDNTTDRILRRPQRRETIKAVSQETTSLSSRAKQSVTKDSAS